MSKYTYDDDYYNPRWMRVMEHHAPDPSDIEMPKSFDELWDAAYAAIDELTQELENAKKAKDFEDARKAALELRWSMKLLPIDTVKELYDMAVHILEVDEWQKDVQAKIDALKEGKTDA